MKRLPSFVRTAEPGKGTSAPVLKEFEPLYNRKSEGPSQKKAVPKEKGAPFWGAPLLKAGSVEAGYPSPGSPRLVLINPV